MRGDSAFVLNQAVQLIAAGGHYKHMTLDDVIGEVLGSVAALDSYHEDIEEPEGTLQ